MLPKEQGLTSQEAEARLEQFGPNILPEKRPPNDFLIFLSQLKNPLVYVLIFAGVVTLILRHTSDTAIIGLAVLVNTVLGFFQERKAGRALVALKKLITAQAEVIRDGKRQKIEAQEIVPGDIAVLSSGMKIPADGKLVYANRLFIDEAVLTGESQPVAKKEEETIFEVIEKEGGPDRAQIEEWKQRYNDKLFAVYFDKNDFYIYRYITLPEWKDVLQQFGNSKVKNDILLDELIVGKGLLFPAFSVELRATVGGGTLETLAKQIRLSSNFLPDDVAIRMIQKL